MIRLLTQSPSAVGWRPAPPISSTYVLPTIEWKSDCVVVIDQWKLPSAEVYATCKAAPEVARAIKTMVIRSADLTELL